ncbi:transposase [Mycobacterium avium]|uniref:transposase n=1 Tax=Mycobacterium avium TaxID=1764 RepID=UPI000C057E2E|nr:transposase [Mycobacterium avium subsp. hominissuis]
MRRTRRSFTPEYRFTAAHRVIDGKERVVDVARELNLNDSVLHTWVRDERWRMSADSAGGLQEVVPVFVEFEVAVPDLRPAGW